MEFRTEISLAPGSWHIDWKDRILTMGSCFAICMGSRLQSNKFTTFHNPLGIVYHPLGLHKAIKYAALLEYPTRETYAQRGDIYVNFDFHSAFSGLSNSDLKERIQNQIATTHHFLKECQILIITYGTAWVFERKDTGEPVANCHQLPSTQFTRRLSSVEELTHSFKETFSILTSRYPQIKIILTVSPVRHIKETLPSNSLSKSTLRVFCEEASKQNDNISYFPAYEIMMDDLRDYRFYHSDMIHPSKLAEEYIWEKFSSVYFDDATRNHLDAWNEISRSMEHRPFHANSKAHFQFLQSLLVKLEKFRKITNVEQELEQIKSRLTEKVE